VPYPPARKNVKPSKRSLFEGIFPQKVVNSYVIPLCHDGIIAETQRAYRNFTARLKWAEE
jgi:hypothetical protein